LVGAVACATTPSLEGFEVTEIDVGGRLLTVAVAETSSERSQGLRGVEQMPAGLDGMLFVFEETRSATFGMRDTLIPLDIWWFNEEGRLLGSTEMEPCTTEDCPTYPSPGEVAWALETPMGEFGFPPGALLEEIPDS
jgi:uncharacterized protein